MEHRLEFMGMVASRLCPACGHHEVGYTTREGLFRPLRPGMMIKVLWEEGMSEVPKEPSWDLGKTMGEGDVPNFGYRVWMPEPIRGDRALCLKYAVLLGPQEAGCRVSRAVYEAAYIEKLRRLIEKEVRVPLAVILDRLFNAPHLASGNPEEIAWAMWRDLAEIRATALVVGDWLERQDEESLAKMVHPGSMDKLSDQYMGDDQLTKALSQMSLEEFLGVVI